MEGKRKAEDISAVLYPNDATDYGKELRLKQQVFFVSASIQARFLALPSITLPCMSNLGLSDPPIDMNGRAWHCSLGVSASACLLWDQQLHAPCLPGRRASCGAVVVQLAESLAMQFPRKVTCLGSRGMLQHPSSCMLLLTLSRHQARR